MRQARVKRDRPAQRIHVPVKRDVTEEHEVETMANDLKERVLAEPDTPVKELMAKTGASKAQIYNWRYEARKKAGLVAAPKEVRKTKAAPEGLQQVTIDPQRPGTAAALIEALARRDDGISKIMPVAGTSEGVASLFMVRLDLTQDEVATLIDRFTVAQSTAFLAGGIKAVILG
jgi:transposase-like protein